MTPRTNGHATILCALGAHCDELLALNETARPGESMPARATSLAGGCAHNVSAGLASLGHAVGHAGIRGADAAGATVARSLARHGVADLALVLDDIATGRYVAMLQPDGTLALAVAAMEAYEHAAALAHHEPFRDAARGADVLVLDANAPADAVCALAACRGPGTRLVLLATSARKAPAIVALLGAADLVLANEGEWARLVELWREPPALALVTRGPKGAVAYRNGIAIADRPAQPVELADVIGAGDAFGAGAIDAWLADAPIRAVLDRGLDRAAACVGVGGPLGWIATRTAA